MMQNETTKPETRTAVSGQVDPVVMCDACDKRGKTWKGDDPKCAFTGGKFGENWNCATVGMVRDICYEGQIETPAGVDFKYCEDNRYATLKVNDIELEDRPLALWVSWYKSRGSTQAMWLLFDNELPRPPTEKECLAIVEFYT